MVGFCRLTNVFCFITTVTQWSTDHKGGAVLQYMDANQANLALYVSDLRIPVPGQNNQIVLSSFCQEISETYFFSRVQVRPILNGRQLIGSITTSQK